MKKRKEYNVASLNRYTLIVAGGSGTRMQSDIPKQFLLLNNKPVLMHTLEKFAGTKIVLVLPSAQVGVWKKLCSEYAFDQPHEIVSGGEKRFHSVLNGLKQISEDGVVAIHDGVRPCVTRDIIDQAFREAEMHDNAVVAVKLKDSVRVMEQNLSRAVNRDLYYLIQTPQTFVISSVKEAYAKAEHDDYTDDASVYEAAGGTVHLIQGDYRNIKITTPEDMLIASVLV